MEQPLIVDDEMSQLPTPNQQAPQGSDPLKSRKKSFYRMGVTEIVFGCLSIILAIVAIAINKEEAMKYSSVHDGYINDFMIKVTYFSQGIWGGIFILITGILAVRTKSSTNRCLYNANMVMTIVSTIVESAVCYLSFGAAGLSLVYSTPLSVLHFIIFAINFVAGILTIVHASFCCCCGLCCTPASATSPRWRINRPDMNNVAVYQPPFHVQVPTGQVLVMVAKCGSVMNQEFMDRSQPVVVHLSEESRFVAEPCRSFYPTRTQGQQNNISSFSNSPISPIQT